MPEDTEEPEQHPSDDSKGEPINSKADEELLKDIRADFTFCKTYWEENYEEAAKDADCVAGIPPKDFRDDRAGRPMIWPDETSQYTTQAKNNLRQNKRSIKVSPDSMEAKDADAEHRENYIRGIEYASQAQGIYSSAFDSCIDNAFGFWRIVTKITGPNGEQEPRLSRIPNWATVYLDPYAKQPDFSDAEIGFVFDTIRETKFQRDYPNAKKRSFQGADSQIAPGWLGPDSTITVAEYWKRTRVKTKDGEDRFKVMQYITNGFEILERHEWLGSRIPIIAVLGAEKYLRTSGTQSKRMFFSMVRRARAAQQMMAYIASQEAEEFQMAPRSPYLVLNGTVDGNEWKDAHREPRAFLRWKIPPEWRAEWGPPPAPTRQPFQPNSQAYEIAYERWRRSHQAAMGMTPLPTAAQRQNEKSGVALERIETQQAVGSYHFLDSFARALHNTGMQLNELITELAKTNSLPSRLLGKNQKDEDAVIQVAPQPQEGQQEETGQNGQPQQGGQPQAEPPDQAPNRNLDPQSEHLNEADYFFAHRGKFAVTISDGPSYQSQREEASAFADTLLQTLPTLGIPPALTQRIVAIAVKLKNIGTYGDEIAELLSPPDPNNIPPQFKAIMAQAQGQIQLLTQELQKLQLEKLGKVTEMQGKMALADKEFQTRMAEADKDRETKMAVAEITALKERVGAAEDMMKQLHDQAHDLGLQIQQQQHEKAMAAAQQAHEQSIAASQQAAAANQQNTQIAADQAAQENQPEAGQ